MSYYVYLLCDPRHDNRPFYVGKGRGDRAKQHLYETVGSTENKRKFYKIKKIKSAGLIPSIVYHTTELCEEAAYELEASLIMFYGREGFEEGGILTNICIDNRPPSALGKLFGPLSEEQKAKIRQSLTGRINGPPSEETKQKIGDAQRGEKNHRYGKSWSEEEKQQRSEFNKENGIKPPVRSGPMSEDQKAAIARGNTGKKRTPEQSAYLSSIRKGKKRKPLSEETKEKI